MTPAEQLVHLVDATFATQNTDDGMRKHLGASVIGDACMRAVWFGWRWADSEKFDGRMLRLFARGQKEEDQFAYLLRSLGAKVWTEDENKKQFRVVAFGGHFGGSMDGVARDVPLLPVPAGTPVLLEKKTHNDKSFADLKKKGVRDSKPKHFKQAQTYMHLSGLEFCLYCAVNKNTDELYFEFFPVDHAIGQQILLRAESVIFSPDLPPRISETPAWHECRFCAMKGVCFGSKMPRVNCRTCVHSKAEQDGTWSCARKRSEIHSCPKQGCNEHVFTPLLFPHVTVTDAWTVADGITYKKRDGSLVTNGPGDTPSEHLDLTC